MDLYSLADIYHRKNSSLWLLHPWIFSRENNCLIALKCTKITCLRCVDKKCFIFWDRIPLFRNWYLNRRIAIDRTWMEERKRCAVWCLETVVISPLTIFIDESGCNVWVSTHKRKINHRQIYNPHSSWEDRRKCDKHSRYVTSKRNWTAFITCRWCKYIFPGFFKALYEKIKVSQHVGSCREQHEPRAVVSPFVNLFRRGVYEFLRECKGLHTAYSKCMPLKLGKFSCV